MYFPGAPPPAIDTLGQLYVPVARGARGARAPLASSVLLGLAAGHRSMMPLATLALARRRRGLVVPILGTMLAIGELIADKLPFVPARTRPLPAIVRALSGATAGGIVARRAGRSSVMGILLGATAAMTTTQLGLRLRRAAEGTLPRIVAGLVEDALAVTLAGVGGGLARPALR